MDADELVSGFRSRLSTLPPDTAAHPGHGPTSRIGSLRWGREFWS